MIRALVWKSRISEVTRRDLVFGALMLVLFIVVMMVFLSFVVLCNVVGLFDDTVIFIVLALAQMLVILVRGIDLSIAANLALCGMLAALFNRVFFGVGVLPVLLITFAAGGLLGAFNGLLVWKLRLPPIVVTLGTLSIYRGVIFLLSKGAWVNENEMSRAFTTFPRQSFLGLTLLTWFALVIFVAFAVTLRRTRIARDLYAAGGNPHAAEYSGIDAGRMQFIAYTICGVLVGVCGYLWVARFAVAYTDIALGFELSVIAACLIGGVFIVGGMGTAVGVLLGCLFIGIIRSSLPLVGISAFWQMFINGAVILVAVLLSARQRDRQGQTLEARP